MNREGNDLTRGLEAVFTQDEFESRIAAARRVLQAKQYDVLIVTGPENIFYLTGQQTPGYYAFQCLVLPVEGDPIMMLRQLELRNYQQNTFNEAYEVYQDDAQPAQVLCDLLTKRGLHGHRIAIEKRGWFLPIAFYDQLRALVGEVADGTGIIEGLRMVKSPAEIAAIERAAEVTDIGLRAGIAAVAEGVSENHVVAQMMAAAIDAGSEYMGMEPLVSSGPRSGIPHATWRRRRLRRGDAMFLEMAGCYNRYHAALMRTAWIGKPPPLARRMMDTCLEALAAAIEAVRPGNSCEAVHVACQRVIDRYGFTDNFRKRTGYSIGISFAPDWGEGNIFSLYKGVDLELRPGMVMHIPPALRDYGKFTVGVSETVIVTETGSRTLSRIDRGLIEV